LGSELKLSWRDALYFILLALLVILFFWRIWIPDPADKARFKASDFTHIFFPARYYAASHIARGSLPLWNPYVSCGYPHFADPQAATFYPIAWVTAFLTGGNLTLQALQWEAIFHFFLAAVFSYLFALCLTGNRIGSLLAAISFTFSGYLTGFPPLQLSMLEADVWLPASLLTVTLAVDRKSFFWAGLAGFSLAMVFLAGRPQSYLTILPLTLAWLFYRASVRKLALRDTISIAIVVMLFCGGFGAIQALPTWELIRLSDRSAITWEYASEGGFAWWELAGFALPHVVGSYALYPGLVALVLATYAIWKRQGLFWFWVALVSLFFSLGKNFALFPVFYLFQKMAFPGYLRNVERVALAFSFSVAMLASMGFASLKEGSSKLQKPLRTLALASVVIWLLASLATKISPLQPPHYSWFLDSLAYDSLLFVAIWSAFEFAGEKLRHFFLPALLLLDLFTINMGRALEPAQGVQPPFDVAEKFKPLQAIPGTFRVDGNESGFRDFGVFLNLESISGMAPLQMAWHKIMAEVEEITRLKLMNVHILVTRREINHGAFKLLYEKDGLKFYAFYGFNPRAYLVAGIRRAHSDGEIVSILNSPDFDPASLAVVPASFPNLIEAPLKEDERVEILRRGETFVTLQVRTSIPRLLVYVESHYPGWQAEIDGHPVKTFKVNGAFRGVIVPEGEHIVLFRYSPTSLYLGCGLSFAALIGLLICAVFSSIGPVLFFKKGSAYEQPWSIGNFQC